MVVPAPARAAARRGSRRSRAPESRCLLPSVDNLLEGVSVVERLDVLADVVRPDDPGAALVGEHRDRHRRRERPYDADVVTGDLGKEALAGHANHDRTAERRERAQTEQELDVVPGRLAK